MGKPNKRHHIDRRADQLIAFHSNIADDQLLNTKQLAALLSVSEQFVELARHKGEGPEWTALGPRCIRYQMGKVRQWLADRARMRAQMLAERRRAIAHMNRPRKPKAVARGAEGA
jgi:predicted DNA-binding transcriptional regulator AlpA